MNRALVAGAALLAGVAIASPMVAWSAPAPAPAQTAQASPPNLPMGQGVAGGEGMADGRGEHWGMGPMGHRGGMMREAMRHQMMRLTPEQRCQERLARRAARVAYTVTKLDLTAQQRPLWDKLNAILQSGTEKEQQLCNALKTAQPGQATILDRVGHMEEFLSARLQTLQQARPALEQLYQALTPEQKTIINHPFMRG